MTKGNLTRKGGGRGQGKGKEGKENSPDLHRKSIGKKRNNKKSSIRNHQLSFPTAKVGRKGQCELGAGRCCTALLAAGEDVSYQ